MAHNTANRFASDNMFHSDFQYVHKCEGKGKILRRISPETIISPSHTSSSQMILFTSRNFSALPSALEWQRKLIQRKKREIYLKAKLLRQASVWNVQWIIEGMSDPTIPRVIRFSSSEFDILDGFMKIGRIFQKIHQNDFMYNPIRDASFWSLKTSSQ